jgi:hypothetical protein
MNRMANLEVPPRLALSNSPAVSAGRPCVTVLSNLSKRNLSQGLAPLKPKSETSGARANADSERGHAPRGDSGKLSKRV